MPVKLILGWIMLLSACSKKTDESTHSWVENYNVKICYIGCFNERSGFADHLIDSLSTDSLYLFIEEGFKNDLVTIYINNKLFEENTFTTNPMLGLSDFLTFGPIKEIKEIGFRMNNGGKAVMEINEGMRMINLNYRDSTLIVSILKHIPAYD